MEIQEHYSTFASVYNAGLWLNGYKLAVSRAIEMLPFKKEHHFLVLDAGCGTGLYTLEILKRFPNALVEAVDINPNMLSKLLSSVIKKGFRNRVNINMFDIEKIWPFGAQFNLIISGGFLEYVCMKRVVAKLSEGLEKGGYFLNSPVKNNILGQFVGKIQLFAPHTLKENLEAFGGKFDLVKRKQFPWYLPVSFVKEIHLFQKR